MTRLGQKMKHQVTRLVVEGGLLASFTGQCWVRQSQSVVSGEGLRPDPWIPSTQSACRDGSLCWIHPQVFLLPAP